MASIRKKSSNSRQRRHREPNTATSRMGTAGGGSRAHRANAARRCRRCLPLPRFATPPRAFWATSERDRPTGLASPCPPPQPPWLDDTGLPRKVSNWGPDQTPWNPEGGIRPSEWNAATPLPACDTTGTGRTTDRRAAFSPRFAGRCRPMVTLDAAELVRMAPSSGRHSPPSLVPIHFPRSWRPCEANPVRFAPRRERRRGPAVRWLKMGQPRHTGRD